MLEISNVGRIYCGLKCFPGYNKTHTSSHTETKLGLKNDYYLCKGEHFPEGDWTDTIMDIFGQDSPMFIGVEEGGESGDMSSQPWR